MKIDIKPIQAELQEIAGNCQLKVKLDNRMDAACSSGESDKGYCISFNPKRIRTKNQLDNHINWLRGDIGGVGI